MDLVTKYLDLLIQFALRARKYHIIHIAERGAHLRLKKAMSKGQNYINSIVESLTRVDQVYRSLSLQHRQLDSEWVTDIWQSLLEGYDNLQTIPPENSNKHSLTWLGGELLLLLLHLLTLQQEDVKVGIGIMKLLPKLIKHQPRGSYQ
jgi:hypothetical protein